MTPKKTVKSTQALTTGNSELNALGFMVDQSIKKAINTAEVVRIDQADQQGTNNPAGYANATPLVSQVDAWDKVLPMTALQHLPYLRPQAGKAAIVMDPQPGDKAIAVCMKRDSTIVKTETKRPVQPGSFRTFDMADGYLINGFLGEAPEIWLHLNPVSGDISLSTKSADIDISCREAGDIAITTNSGSVTINCTEKATVNCADIVLNGDVRVTGNLAVEGETTGHGGGPARFSNGIRNRNGIMNTGGFSNAGGTVSSNGVVLDDHRHTGVEPGGGTSANPLAEGHSENWEHSEAEVKARLGDYSSGTLGLLDDTRQQDFDTLIQGIGTKAYETLRAEGLEHVPALAKLDEAANLGKNFVNKGLVEGFEDLGSLLFGQQSNPVTSLLSVGTTLSSLGEAVLSGNVDAILQAGPTIRSSLEQFRDTITHLDDAFLREWSLESLDALLNMMDTMQSVGALSPGEFDDAALRQIEEELGDSLTETDRLLLCLPRIADAEANNAKNEADCQGWLNLREMLIKWLTGKANSNPTSNSEPYWVDWNWIMSFERAREAYQKFTTTGIAPNIYREVAQQSLAEILSRDKERYFTDKRENFDFTALPWTEWEAAYHTSISVPEISLDVLGGIDGLLAAMGSFTLRALAAGWVEPTGDGWYSIHVTKVAVFVCDGFNFEKEGLVKEIIGLGPWSCENLSFGDAFNGTWLDNDAFRDFRERHNLGGDFIVLSQLHMLESFQDIDYAYACQK
jgi:phage baseplate assembly protein gpV